MWLFKNISNFLVDWVNLGNASLNCDNPLLQFSIQDLLILHHPTSSNIYSIANINIYLFLSICLSFSFSIIYPYYKDFSSNPVSSAKDTLYDTIKSIVTSQINNKLGQYFFPLLYLIFVYILANNLIGMVPYSFSDTAHVILTFALSFTIVIASTILGALIFKLKFLSLLVPAGCPLALLPLLTLIEFVSYLARNISLGLRLAANILSGHMLLNILSGFTFKMTTDVKLVLLSVVATLFITAFSGLELAIAFIQAQVFLVLSCSYIRDGLQLH
jgi:F-type H+-transporting ATPase subunit a